MITPREYQLEALEAVTTRRGEGITRQLINLPTGTGKTVVFSLLAKDLNVRTLVIAHTEELIKQAEDKFKVVWPEVDVGILKAEQDRSDAHVVIASIQTACREKRLEKLKEQGFGLLIVDEAHHSAAPSYMNVLRELGFLNEDPNKLLVGVTATPKRGDGVGLGGVFEEIVFERSINTMIRAGYLSPLIGKQIFTKIELGGIAVSHGDFVASELSRMVNTPDRNRLILDNYLKYASDRKKALAFCADVQHAKDLAATFGSHGGITAKAVYGSMEAEEREQVLEEFAAGKIQILCNCNLLTEGFDEPSIDCILLARPTKSTALFTQMIGRGTRTHPLKSNCLVLDYADNSSRHDLCSYKNTLDGTVAALFDDESDEIDEEGDELARDEIVEETGALELRVYQEKIENIEFFDKAQFAWTPVGDSWHLSLTVDRDVWARQVNGGFLVVSQSAGSTINLSSRPLPLDYALGVAEDWARKQTTESAWARKDAAWRAQPATQKQIDTLARAGCRFEHGISKGEAALLLDNIFNEPPTPKQLFYLRRNGVEMDPAMTKIKACKLIATIKGGQNVQR